MREVVYHPQVPGEVREIIGHYEGISTRLADEFWAELLEAIEFVKDFPERHHFDPSGRRRCNLKKFPFHILFRITANQIRVTVVRHNQRHPKFGSRRT